MMSGGGRGESPSAVLRRAISRLLLRAVLKKAKSASDLVRAAASVRFHTISRLQPEVVPTVQLP